MAFDGDARGRVPEVNAVVGFIYFLAASPASADKAFLQILFTDAQGLHPFPESCQFSGLTIAGGLQGVNALPDSMGQHVPAGGRHGAKADGNG